MIDPNEIWQANVNGEIYEAEFSGLVDWIAEGALLETDKVCRGNLRWLDAGKVPALAKFFTAKANGAAMPELPGKPQLEGSDNEPPGSEEHAGSPDHPLQHKSIEPVENVTQKIDQDHCSIHPDATSEYLCQTCDHPFCRSCPKSYGGTVRICPYCGAMCKLISALKTEQARRAQYDGDISNGFGFSDFGKALVYPFHYKVSLIFGGLMFAFLSLGKGAAGLGGIFMAAAALICILFANALTFGVLANTLDNFSQGFTDRDFMPSFDDFSLWDDVVHPFFLSIAVYISSFGLFIVLIAAAGWMAWTTFSEQAMISAQQKNSQSAPSKPELDLKKIKEISEQYKERKSLIEHQTRVAEGLTDEQQDTIRQEAEFRKLTELAKSGNAGQINKAADNTASNDAKISEQRQRSPEAVIVEFIKGAGILLVFAGLAFLWGLCYFPAACAVAGYTRSFGATLNPLIGIDTIKHLGLDYLKILVMVIMLSIMSGIVMAFLGTIFSPFNLGQMGNPPVTFFGSFATFYFSIAFAVTLGFALYKNGEKLNLYRG
ncbi:MAG: hypothetical protein KDB79_01985 [Acidobacteria bacterium]|nr:hypothetical protein [Acidobacteriota bacterium]